MIAREPGDPGLFLALAPMDGVTDHVHRGLVSDLFGGRSGMSMCVSEFVRVTNQLLPPKVFRRHCPELDHGSHTASGVPVFVQLLGGIPQAMADNAARVAEMGAIGIDLNFGCPAKTVNNHDGGATLLKTPRRVYDVTRAVRMAVPDDVRVTVKVRIGWDSADPMVEIAKAAEDAGGDWLTIHARTKAQLYKPPVDWAAIGRAREAVSIPVVANGDLFSPAAIELCRTVSGCNAFMIGRGALGHPELFAWARGWRDGPLTLPQHLELLLEYGNRVVDSGAGERGALGRFKQWLRMAALVRADVKPIFDQVKRLGTLEQARAAVAQLLPQPTLASRRSSEPSMASNSESSPRA